MYRGQQVVNEVGKFLQDSCSNAHRATVAEQNIVRPGEILKQCAYHEKVGWRDKKKRARKRVWEADKQNSYTFDESKI